MIHKHTPGLKPTAIVPAVPWTVTVNIPEEDLDYLITVDFGGMTNINVTDENDIIRTTSKDTSNGYLSVTVPLTAGVSTIKFINPTFNLDPVSISFSYGSEYVTYVGIIPAWNLVSLANFLKFTAGLSMQPVTLEPGFLNNNANTLTSFSRMFEMKTIVSVPSGLFDLCTEALDLSYVFTTATIQSGVFPALLFANCLKANTFRYCFKDVTAQISSDLFYSPENKSTRFAQVPGAISFYYTFYSNTSPTGDTAPDLWNCTFNTPPVTTLTFGAVVKVAARWTNAADIPTAWK